MATLTATIKLISADVTSDALSLSEGPALTVGSPSSLSTKTLTTGGTEIFGTSQAVRTYVYIKNTHGSISVVVKTAGGVTFAILAPGEVNFFTLYPDLGLKLFSESSTATVEYGYWSKA